MLIDQLKNNLELTQLLEQLSQLQTQLISSLSTHPDSKHPILVQRQQTVDGIQINELQFNESLIKKIHAAIIRPGEKGVTVSNRKSKQVKVKSGEYRKIDAGVQVDNQVHKFIAPQKIYFEVTQLCSWINKALTHEHPVFVAICAHFDFVRIHPFTEGNGRTARILMNLILMKQDYPHVEFDIENKNFHEQYCAVLELARRGDLYPFAKMILELLIRREKIILEKL